MRSLLAFAILASALRADPLAGAWETFPSQANTDAWSLYSYYDEIVAPPLWAGPEIDENPYAYSFFLGGKGVWFFADEFTAGGTFVGDYAAEKITGVDLSVSIDPAEIDFIDLVVYADGPLGPDYYYSLIYLPEDLGSLPGWYNLSFSFEDNWFSLQDGASTPFKPDQGFLASIQEVGVRVFPIPGVTGESFVAVDDFILVPTVDAPPLSTSLAAGDFVLEFTPNPGVSATIETLAPNGKWRSVDGQTDLTGPQTFATPVGPDSALFRVVTEEKLTQVTSP